MIKQLTPKYLFICDRCGREEYKEDDVPEFQVDFVERSSVFELPTRTKGEVCYNCYKDFCEIAENFFNEVNKE